MGERGTVPVGLVQSASEERRLWTECPTCAGTISRGTNRCPHCGSRIRRKWIPSRSRRQQSDGYLAALGAFLVGIAIGWWLANRRRRTTRTKES